jgi:predicted nucleotidyltransferase
MLTLEQVRTRRADILQLAERYGMRRVRVFGSVARGETHAESDVDFLVEVERGRSLLDLAGFELDLKDLLGCEVDVVSEGGMSPYMAPYIMAEATPL